MKADSLLLAIDQGTSSTRAFIFDAQGQSVAVARRNISLDHRSATEVEQSAVEIRGSVIAVINDVLGMPGVDISRVAAAGLATQRSSVLAWSRSTGEALSPVLSWQDRRAGDYLRTLDIDEKELGKITGLRLSAHYGAGKLHWLLLHEPEVIRARKDGDLVMGPLASYLLHHLVDADREMVDHANAARTLLWNIETRDWYKPLLDLFAIPDAVLPVCLPISADYGNIEAGNIPLQAVSGDQVAALYARGNPCMNTIQLNVGTGAFILLPIEDASVRLSGLLTGISYSDCNENHYCLEGTVNGAGAALNWLQTQYSERHIEAQLDGWLETVENGPIFLNTVGGLGSPWWVSESNPCFLDPPENMAEAAVAVLESIVFLIQANVERLCEFNPSVQSIRISGGLANLDGFCQKLADLSGLKVNRPAEVEATARGIAWLAADRPQAWEDAEAGELFSPVNDGLLIERYRKFLERIV